MAITYVNTTEIESIASDLISLSNEYIDEINKSLQTAYKRILYELDLMNTNGNKKDTAGDNISQNRGGNKLE